MFALTVVRHCAGIAGSDERRQREETITLVEVIITVIAIAEAKTNGFEA